MRRIRSIARLVTVASVALFAVISAPAGAAGTRHDVGTGSTACSVDTAVSTDSGTLSWTPTTLWSPNGSLVPVTLTYSGPHDQNGEVLNLTVNSITSSDGGGSSTIGTSTPGAEGGAAATAQVSIEASRAGSNPNGRTYTINVTCSEVEGGSLPQTVNIQVTVPHNQPIA